MAKSLVPDISPEEVRELISYDPVTGIMRWKWRYNLKPKAASWNARNAGNPILTKDSKGYIFLSIYKQKYRAHRVAWAHGQWPILDLDHINLVKTDNRIENLREATVAQNGHNVGLINRNTSGARGVFWHRGARKWQASIFCLGKSIYLGLHMRFEDAVAVRRAAELKYYGEYAKKG